MVNKCINIITVCGAYDLAREFCHIADNVFCNGILHNDGAGNAEKYYNTFTVYSYLKMPKMELLNITLSMKDTGGFIVRVVSNEPWGDYYETAEFKDNAWNFESVQNIEKEFPKINRQGFEKIRELIKEHGAFDVRGWNIDYYDRKEEERISDYYQHIGLSENGKLYVVTREKVILGEEDLNTCHIVDILWFIDRNKN